MTRSSLAVISAIVVAGSVFSWSIQRQAAVRLQETRGASRELAGQLAQLQEDNLWLSSQIAQRKPFASLPDDQFRELLRLRGEVGRLRGDRRETDQLHATNQQLLATLAKSERAQTVQVRWASDQLAFAGYADPESAMVSTLWGLNNGDPDFYLSMLTPDQKAVLEKAGKSEETAAIYRKIGELLYPPTTTGISLVGKKLNSPDEAVVDLYYEGEGKTRKFILKRTDGAWKLHDLVSITAN
jgi:hypothetical protein